MPHGGRDLTAAQAKAHEDITFVWWVIDQIMDLDRRAWWLKHWVHGTRAFLTPQVFDLREPVLLVCNDNDDAYWHHRNHRCQGRGRPGKGVPPGARHRRGSDAARRP